MLAVISPAKTLDFETPLRISKHTAPEFTEQASALNRILRRKSAAELGALMHISDKLATLNAERFRDWVKEPDETQARAAVLAFMGDVYTGLDARSLKTTELDYAQKHLRILSGLYGVLRPLDWIQPYRLEMGTQLGAPKAPTLYRFWGQLPTDSLNAQARALKTRYLVNLASQEYFGAVDSNALEPTVITPVFKDWSKDRYKVISFHAKRARGLMARFMIQQRAKKPADLEGFNAEGYAFDRELSSALELVFTRRQ